jgi:hypothetical protein
MKNLPKLTSAYGKFPKIISSLVQYSEEKIFLRFIKVTLGPQGQSKAKQIFEPNFKPYFKPRFKPNFFKYWETREER